MRVPRSTRLRLTSEEQVLVAGHAAVCLAPAAREGDVASETNSMDGMGWPLNYTADTGCSGPRNGYR